MTDYTPDVWIVVELSGSKIQAPNNCYHRILAGWFGGFAGADSWKINSGIERIVETDDCYVVHGSSGSIYYCHKHNERTNRYTQGILENFAKENSDELAINMVKMESILPLYKKETAI